VQVAVEVQMELEPLALAALVVVEMEQFHQVLLEQERELLTQVRVAVEVVTGDLQEVMVEQVVQAL
jgi:hypothetical protein